MLCSGVPPLLPPPPLTHLPTPCPSPPCPAVDADGQISVLNGDKKMVSAIPTATGAPWVGAACFD